MTGQGKGPPGLCKNTHKLGLADKTLILDTLLAEVMADRKRGFKVP